MLNDDVTYCITRVEDENGGGRPFESGWNGLLLVPPPAHHSESFEWRVDSFLQAFGGDLIVVWRPVRRTYDGDMCPVCGKMIGPPYGEGFLLVCPCGQRMESYTDVRHRLFRWRAVNGDVAT